MGVMDLRRRIMLNEPHIVTTTPAGIANFSTDLIAPLKSCKVEFSPVQSGSGDPSPDNVRPISGWTGCNISHAGSNLLNLTAENVVFITVPTLMTITYSGDTVSLTSTYNFANFVVWDLFEITPAMVGEKITCKTGTTGDGLALSDNNWVNAGTPVTLPYTIASSDVGKRFGFRLYTYGQTTNTFEKLVVNFGTKLADYEPYTGSTIPIDWTTEAGTVYGGYVDLVTGELVAEWNLVDLGTLGWERVESNTSGIYYFRTTSNAIPAKYYSGDGMKLHLMSSAYVTETANRFVFGIASNNSIGVNDGLAVRVRNDAFSDSTNFKIAMSGVHLAYELATPITYQLTPTQLKSLRGVNNIWSDANGDTTVKYWTH